MSVDSLTRSVRIDTSAAAFFNNCLGVLPCAFCFRSDFFLSAVLRARWTHKGSAQFGSLWSRHFFSVGFDLSLLFFGLGFVGFCFLDGRARLLIVVGCWCGGVDWSLAFGACFLH